MSDYLEVINERFEADYPKPSDSDVGTAIWYAKRSAYLEGWIDRDRFEREQAQRDADYQDQLQEEEALRRGLA